MTAALATLATGTGFDPFEAKQQAWLDSLTEKWPPSWRRDALRLHAHRRAAEGLSAANHWLSDLAEKIDSCRIRPDATDGEIMDTANKQAKRASDRAARWSQLGTPRMRRELESLCVDWGIEPPPASKDDQWALAQMTDSLWWRRRLRKQWGRDRERISIALGYVHAKRDLYISAESFEADRHKRSRNAAILEDMEAISEDGEVFTVAELAEHSIANPALRRGEMMTRIKGYETEARDRGHAGIFVTLTCPSRMHARFESTGAANPAYDDITPRKAQAYLRDLWKNIRSKFKNSYIDFYGMRVAEPHHDATPHWHLLLFVSPLHIATVKNIIRAYALRDSPGEPGAQARRVTFNDIDPAKGGAAAYIAKYIGKNIDGTGIDLDENGLPAKESVSRVTAWASLHGLRQFQFIGGPPVGLWREMRRVPKAAIADAPEAIGEAWRAAQKTETRQADFAGLIRAVGGPTVKRAEQAIQLATAIDERPGRYGWATNEKPVGIFHREKPKKIYRSERKVWKLSMRTGEFGRRFTGDWAAAHRPWTRVNNCAARSASGFRGGTVPFEGSNVIPFPGPGLSRPPDHAGGPPSCLSLGGST